MSTGAGSGTGTGTRTGTGTGTAPSPARRAWPVETHALLVAAAALALLLASGQLARLTLELQLVVALGLVAVAGVPHGALDPWVARRSGLWRSGRGLAAFSAAYLVLVLAVVGIWMLAPVVSLAGFLLVSAWHFGGDWRVARQPVLRLGIGLCLLALPAVREAAAVGDLYALLSGDAARALADAQAAGGWAVVVAFALLAAAAARVRGRDGVELAALGGLALAAPPLAFFAVYFCFLHSPRHLRQLWQPLAPAPRRALVAVALAYTAATTVLLVLAWMLMRAMSPAPALDATLARLLFIGLAALTVPHMALVQLAQARERRAQHGAAR